MLVGNKFFKLNSEGEVEKLTTDDIPEGEYNKYDLTYADGKSIGDIVLRLSSEEISAHNLLNGQNIYAYDHPAFYEYCSQCKELALENEKYEFFNKTESQYNQFLNNNVWPATNENFCPYFVVSTTSVTVYEVTRNSQTGFTPLSGSEGQTVAGGNIYKTTSLSEVIDTRYDEWVYTGNSSNSTIGYVRIPTLPTYINGDIRGYYFIVTKSRVDDESTSIRSVQVGTTTKLPYSEEPYVRNSGTMQNLILDFGIPEGLAATIQIGNVSSGEIPAVTNSGDEINAILNFVFPKGDRGDDGGVIVLHHIGTTYPLSPKLNDKFYNENDNKIYIYNGSSWQYFEDATSGVIYLYNNIVYYYDGTNLNQTKATASCDNITIKPKQNLELEAVGVVGKHGGVVYDWLGILSNWENDRSNGVIPDNCVCFVTDD